jgi:hypothetical protein
LCGAETWTLRKVDEKKTWKVLKCVAGEGWRRSVGPIVRNEEALHRVKEERNIVHTVNRRKADWIGHILGRNCLLKHVIKGTIEGSIQVKGRRGKRHKQLLDDLKETGIESLNRTL